jgi:endonuclease-3 related protein
MIKKLYYRLLKKYGKPAGQWKLWCKRPKTTDEKEEIIIGAVLGQRTNWNNAEMAIDNLKKQDLCSLKNIYQLNQKNRQKLSELIRSSGFFKQKAQRLLNLSEFVLRNYGSVEKMQQTNFAKLRKELLVLNGLGPETVDDILLYALEKPVFVIDEYTRRLVKKYKLAKDLSYDALQRLFEKKLKKDYALYQDFHALIVIEGKTPPGQRLLLK